MEKIGNRFFSLLLFFLILSFPTIYSGQWGAQAQNPTGESVSVSASVSQTEIEMGQPLKLSIKVVSSNSSQEPGEPRLPDLQGFDLVNRSTGIRTRSFNDNGKFNLEISRTFDYVLSPQKTGKIRIGEAEVVVSGKAYSTKPILITVKPASGKSQAQRPQAADPLDPFNDDEMDPFSFMQKRMQQMQQQMQQFGGADDEDFSNLLKKRPGGGAGGNSKGSTFNPSNPNEAFFIHVEVDKKQAYVGEQVTVSFYLYTRSMIRDIDTLKYPDLKSFYREDIEVSTRLSFQEEVVNGLVYRKALLASYALFPIKAGTALIDSYKAKCSVVGATGSPFNAFGMGQVYTYTKASPEVKIQVMELPAHGVPPSYTGAVGDFNVTGKVANNNVPINQPFSYKLRIEGRGRASSIDLPAIQFPDGLELYDTKAEAKYFPTGESFKEFELFLIPRKPGAMTIPEISLGVFDPKTKSYTEKKTPPIQVMVGAGKGGENIAGQPMALEEKRPVNQIKLPEPGLFPDKKPLLRAVPRPIFWSVVYLFIFGTLLWKARIELGWGEGRRTVVYEIQRRFKQIRSEADKGNFRSVGAMTLNATYFVFGEVAREKGSTVPLDRLMLRVSPSVRDEIEKPLATLLPIFESLSFAPEGILGELKNQSHLVKKSEEMEKLLTRAAQLGFTDVNLNQTIEV